jgi:hypothetical protein
MLMNVFALYDKKVCAYGNPFCASHPAQALRMLQQLVNSKDNQVAQYAEDYDLYDIASFDDCQGKFVCDEIKFVVNAASLRVSQSPFVDEGKDCSPATAGVEGA